MGGANEAYLPLRVENRTATLKASAYVSMALMSLGPFTYYVTPRGGG